FRQGALELAVLPVTGKEPQVGDLARHPLGVGGAVVPPHPEQNNDPSSDRARGLSGGAHRGAGHALDHRPHRPPPLLTRSPRSLLPARDAGPPAPPPADPGAAPR